MYTLVSQLCCLRAHATPIGPRMTAWHDDLGTQQRPAAGLAADESAVLLAGPGTGKTFVLVRRVQFLIEDAGVPASEITALTFTRAAAAEMRERLEERLGSAGGRVRVSTLHSYAMRELMRRPSAGTLPRPLRMVDDWEEDRIVVEELKRLLRCDKKDVRELLKQLEAGWSELRVDDAGWNDVLSNPAFLATWRQHREVYGYTLRGELLYQLLQELISDPHMAPDPTQVVLVDEYQDLNKCDLSVLDLLAERAGAALYVCGDDDQSIYGFRSAHPVGIRSFVNEHQGAQLLEMTECRRCGEQLVAFANWVISHDTARIDKQLRSVTDYDTEIRLVRPYTGQAEPAAVAELAAAHIANGTAAEKVLILLRGDKHGNTSRPVIEHLQERGIDSYLPRRQPEEPDELQRLLEWLQLETSLSTGDRPDELAVRALLELEDNGIGSTRVQAVVDHAIEHKVTFTAALELLRVDPSGYTSTSPQNVITAYDSILERAGEFSQREDETLAAWVLRTASLADLSEEARAEVERAMSPVLAELAEEQDNDETEQRRFAQVLRESLARADDLPTSEEGKVTITTMHGAKGLTADVVFVLQAEDELLPGEPESAADEAEIRRLLYVSLTRARRWLYVSAAVQRFGADQFTRQGSQPNRQVTRFLRDYGLPARTPEQLLREVT